MSSADETPTADVQRRPRSRKSTGHLPSPEVESGVADQENNGLGLGIGLQSITDGPSFVDGKKKLRSKSPGPGGIDALREETGNRQKISGVPIIKSILKPAIPLSPLREIPTRKGSPRKGSPRKIGTSPAKLGHVEGLLIDFSTATKRSPKHNSKDAATSFVSDPFGSEAAVSLQPERVSLRTEEEQHAATREREEGERRKKEKDEIIRQRDERRKSMANRRVSFAPEATLHTWDVVEYMQDSTTSSASTNTTRRASAMTASMLTSTHPNLESQLPGLGPAEPPSTPPHQVEDTVIRPSPAPQRELHQKKRRRRSSATPPMNLNDQADTPSSSPYSGSSATESDVTGIQEEGEEVPVRLEIDSEKEQENQSPSLDNGDDTIHSAVSSASSGSSTGSSGRLEEALRQAANQAGTRGIEYDENGDLSMEMAEDEVTAALKPWLQQDINPSHRLQYLRTLDEQENINPFSPAFKASFNGNSSLQAELRPNEDDEMSMDVTRAIGGIIPATMLAQRNMTTKSTLGPGQHIIRETRQSSRRSSAFEDQSMELTKVVGGIRQSSIVQLGAEAADEEEDAGISMDLTAAFGAIGSSTHKSAKVQHHTTQLYESRPASRGLINGTEIGTASPLSEDQDMQITTALGTIVNSGQDQADSLDNQTMDMDLRTAIGEIVPNHLKTHDRLQAKALMEQETDAGDLTFSPISLPHSKSPKRARRQTITPNDFTSTGSPSKATSHRRWSSRNVVSPMPQSPTRESTTPISKPVTPLKQMTPEIPLPQPTTPGKTSPMMNVTMRTASPKNLLKEFLKQSVSAPKSGSPIPFLKFNADAGPTPTILLPPRARRTSGLGVDKEGLGSPRVAAILDRRRSISDEARTFVAQTSASQGVRFEDPRIITAEVEKERAENERRESGRFILEQEADGHEEVKDATLNLKEMIGTLTPKKGKLKGRKSLAVGGARGLLGKRPVELDEEDEDNSPVGLRGREASPVKRIRLQAPPSKVETTGKLAVPKRKSAEPVTPSTQTSPIKNQVATTPKSQGRFKDVEAVSPPRFAVPNGFNLEDVVQEAQVDEHDRIHLQDFLNLTNIRFMELNTTKRRHTTAPTGVNENDGRTSSDLETNGDSRDLESCIAAGACTVPMLELYQHSCRELKRYISEGRDIVREIEADTYADNPPLFREYMSAAPEARIIMDNQFKNVRTHARLQSKKMWYQWRLVLLEGLKEGLIKIGEGMIDDDALLLQQEELLASVLPGLIEEHEELERETARLQNEAVVVAEDDHEELEGARQRLISIEAEIEQKKQMLLEVQSDYEGKMTAIEQAAERKSEYIEEIREADRVREECRGWSASEVEALRAKVDALESSHGWRILSSSSTTVTMLYQHELQLFFDTASFLPNNTTTTTLPENMLNTPISLTYIDISHDHQPAPPLSTEKRFFLQLMRAHLQCVQQNQIRIADLLSFVSAGWRQALAVAEEIRRLKRACITDVDIVSDERLVVTCMLLLEERRTRVDVYFAVEARVAHEDGTGNGNGNGKVEIVVRPRTEVRYGEKLDEGRMNQVLEKRVGGKVKEEMEVGRFEGAVVELRERLMIKKGGRLR